MEVFDRRQKQKDLIKSHTVHGLKERPGQRASNYPFEIVWLFKEFASSLTHCGKL